MNVAHGDTVVLSSVIGQKKVSELLLTRGGEKFGVLGWHPQFIRHGNDGDKEACEPGNKW